MACGDSDSARVGDGEQSGMPPVRRWRRDKVVVAGGTPKSSRSAEREEERELLALQLSRPFADRDQTAIGNSRGGGAGPGTAWNLRVDVVEVRFTRAPWVVGPYPCVTCRCKSQSSFRVNVVAVRTPSVTQTIAAAQAGRVSGLCSDWAFDAGSERHEQRRVDVVADRISRSRDRMPDGSPFW